MTIIEDILMQFYKTCNTRDLADVCNRYAEKTRTNLSVNNDGGSWNKCECKLKRENQGLNFYFRKERGSYFQIQVGGHLIFEISDGEFKQFNKEKMKSFIKDYSALISLLSAKTLEVKKRDTETKTLCPTFSAGILKEMLKDVPDDAQIEINSIYNEFGEWETSDVCEMHYDEKRNRFFITPTYVENNYSNSELEERE